MSSFFETPPPLRGAASTSVSELALPLALAKGWIKLIAILNIVVGALQALSIIGILWAWLPIWMGVLLLNAANAVEQAQRNDDAEALKLGLGKLRTYFVVQGVLFLIGIVLTLIMLLVYGAVLAAMLAKRGAL